MFKPTGFGSVFQDKNRFKPVWLGFFRFGFCSVWFFRFQAYKTEPVGFFKILIVFFHNSVFSVIFFSGFLGLIGFLIFLLTPTLYKHRLGLGFKEPQSDRGEERTGTKKKRSQWQKTQEIKVSGKSQKERRRVIMSLKIDLDYFHLNSLMTLTLLYLSI